MAHEAAQGRNIDPPFAMSMRVITAVTEHVFCLSFANSYDAQSQQMTTVLTVHLLPTPIIQHFRIYDEWPKSN